MSRLDRPPVCPRCRENDRVEKASAIYVEGLASARRLKNAGAEGAPRRLTRIAPDAVRELSKRLSPPAAPTRIQVRPIHPDLVVLAFTLILPLFVSGIASRQRGMLVPILVFLALVYGLYLLARARILGRFTRQEAERQAEANRYKKAIDAWMQLYYCDKDGILFFPGSLKSAPVDEANRLLFEDRENR